MANLARDFSGDGTVTRRRQPGTVDHSAPRGPPLRPARCWRAVGGRRLAGLELASRSVQIRRSGRGITSSVWGNGLGVRSSLPAYAVSSWSHDAATMNAVLPAGFLGDFSIARRAAGAGGRGNTVHWCRLAAFNGESGERTTGQKRGSTAPCLASSGAFASLVRDITLMYGQHGWATRKEREKTRKL